MFSTTTKEEKMCAHTDAGKKMDSSEHTDANEIDDDLVEFLLDTSFISRKEPHLFGDICSYEELMCNKPNIDRILRKNLFSFEMTRLKRIIEEFEIEFFEKPDSEYREDYHYKLRYALALPHTPFCEKNYAILIVMEMIKVYEASKLRNKAEMDRRDRLMSRARKYVNG